MLLRIIVTCPEKAAVNAMITKRLKTALLLIDDKVNIKTQ
jgi:hypothetical protein